MKRCISIRAKIMITILILIMVDASIILWLESRVEKKFYRVNMGAQLSEPLAFNSLFNMVLMGDINSSYRLRTRAPMLGEDGKDGVASIIKRLKQQILLVFGLTIVTGMLLSFYIAKGISKPILRLANVSNNIANGKLNDDLESPGCTEVKVLTESFKKMQTEILEHEEEKTRSESVEITKRLAAGIAHEIKNPINTVGLIVDYLQTNLSPEDPKKRYEFYKLSENIKGELKRINKMVEGFLRLTKPDIFNFEKDNINNIIKDSVSAHEPEIIKYNIKLKLKLSNNIPKIKVDKEKFKQVFSNLIINAVEAMPRGGEIFISTSKIDPDNVKIQIDDNGIGIPSENINKIFNPYYTTKKQGFGIGLPLVHNIVCRHNGKINVKSIKGKGTNFTLILPVGLENE